MRAAGAWTSAASEPNSNAARPTDATVWAVFFRVAAATSRPNAESPIDASTAYASSRAIVVRLTPRSR